MNTRKKLVIVNDTIDQLHELRITYLDMSADMIAPYEAVFQALLKEARYLTDLLAREENERQGWVEYVKETIGLD